MVIFHFIYDLKYFGFVDWDTPDGSGWREFRYVILTLFFTCMGIGLAIAHRTDVQWRKFALRLAQIAAGALAVTVMSLFTVPNNWIYFGVLHFIFVATLLALPLLRKPNLALVISGVILVAYNMDWIQGRWPFNYIREYLPYYTNDYVPLFPWLALVYFGVWLSYQSYLLSDPLKKCHSQPGLILPGRHSLIIYLLHQPLMFAGFYTFLFLTSLG